MGHAGTFGRVPTCDMDDAFCLILMDWYDKYPRQRPSLVDLRYALRESHPEATAGQVATLWGKYVGWDGRISPTHDYLTQQRL